MSAAGMVTLEGINIPQPGTEVIGPDDWNYIDHIPGWMGRRECNWLAALARQVNSWTEVGTYCGRSMVAVGLHLLPHSLLQVVDIEFREGFCTSLGWLTGLRPDLHIITCAAGSVEAASRLHDTEVCFIDADHQEDSVTADILAWQHKCKILCGHDYQPHWAGVMRAVDKLCPGALNPVDDIWLRA